MYSAEIGDDYFHVFASNAIDYLAGTQAAGALLVNNNLIKYANVLDVDVKSVKEVVLKQADVLADVDLRGFDAVKKSLDFGFGSLGVLSAINIAVQVAGFSVVSSKLNAIESSISSVNQTLRAEFNRVSNILLSVGEKLDSLIFFAEKSLITQERILNVLACSRSIEAQQLIKQGWENFKHGFVDDAVLRYQKAIELDNTAFVAHACLAEIFYSQGDVVLSESCYKRAIAFSMGVDNGVCSFLLIQYAKLLDGIGRSDEAIDRARSAVELEGRDDWKYYLSRLLVKVGNVGEALSLLEDVIKSSPDYFPASILSMDFFKLNGFFELLVRLDSERREKSLEVYFEYARLQQFYSSLRNGANFGAIIEGDKSQAHELLVKVMSSTYVGLHQVDVDIRKVIGNDVKYFGVFLSGYFEGFRAELQVFVDSARKPVVTSDVFTLPADLHFLPDEDLTLEKAREKLEAEAKSDTTTYLLVFLIFMVVVIMGLSGGFSIVIPIAMFVGWTLLHFWRVSINQSNLAKIDEQAKLRIDELLAKESAGLKGRELVDQALERLGQISQNLAVYKSDKWFDDCLALIEKWKGVIGNYFDAEVEDVGSRSNRRSRISR